MHIIPLLLIDSYQHPPPPLLSPPLSLSSQLHAATTDYISPRLTQMMIDFGKEAAFMKDKKGWLPAHVACSRHCSPEKLNMLLAVNPNAIFAETDQGQTPLDLAVKTATKTHPNR